MSVITDMVLLTNARDDSPALVDLRAWCDEHASGQRFERIPTNFGHFEDRGFVLKPGGPRPQPVPDRDEFAGGHKVFTTRIYACAGNYFPWSELLVALPKFRWRNSYEAGITIVLVKYEGGDNWIGMRADGQPIQSGRGA